MAPSVGLTRCARLQRWTALICAASLALATLTGCGGDRTAQRRAARAASVPPDVASWPTAQVRAAFATIRYALPGGAAIRCAGVAVGDDGTILTCWHLIDAVSASLAGATVYGAYAYGFPKGDAYRRYQALRAAPPRMLALDIEYGGARSRGAALVGWMPDADLALVRIARATPRFLRPGAAPDGAAIGLLGLGGGLPPQFSFGHLTGAFAALPVADGDSGGPLFTRDGRLVGIQSLGSSDEVDAWVSLVTAAQLDALRAQEDGTASTPAQR